ncbi:MAG TPA: hypothetical protein VFH17_07085, partial [Coriobacteriia bacterium]|nr:hypothetical protein [Coriobacteriia bacterium]
MIARILLTAAGAAGGLAVTRLVDWTAQTGYPPYVIFIIFIILGSSVGYVFGGIFGREFLRIRDRSEQHLRDMAPV